MSNELKRTSLYDCHVALEGRLVPFAGYEMPVQYKGILAEATAVRNASGMFDVSHMARLTVTGEGALDFLQRLTSNDVATLAVGHGHYSLLTNPEGGTIDDIIISKVGPEEYRMVVNASNHEKDYAWLTKNQPPNVQIVDETDETVMIAVQGPEVVDLVARLSNVPLELKDLSAFGIQRAQVAGVDGWISRTGYTGEDGFELVCDQSGGETLWNALLESGVTPCGLGSRDTLRVEAGYPLYGHELAEDLSPIAAGLGWVISSSKSFSGSEPIAQARKLGTPTKLFGIRLDSKRMVPSETPVLIDGTIVGKVSSGVVSPVMKTAIALAFLDSSVKLHSSCQLDLRGKLENGTIVSKRFYKRA